MPSYNPTTVYGTWAYPSYPPYYYPPPPDYYPGAAFVAGLAFGAGVAIVASLWGDCDWGDSDIDIDVDRYNNINSNRQINRNQNNPAHNSANRDGVPYRDRASREQYGRQLDGAGQRDNFRGHDPARAADRDRARQSMSQRGFETPATSNREARDRAGQASQQMGRQQGRATWRALARSAMRRPATARVSSTRQPQWQSNSAFAGAGNPGQSRASANRGHGSYSASQRSGSRSGGRQMSRPARSGGGGRRR